MDWWTQAADVPSLVIANFEPGGRLRWANAGFARLHDGSDEEAWRRFISPVLWPWLQDSPANSLCVHEGLMTLAAPAERMVTLRGRISIGPDGIWVIAGYDMAEAERVGDALLDLNAQLQQTQRDLARVNRRLRQSEAEILAVSRTDALTGVANRRGLDEALVAEVARHARSQKPLSIAILDIDHFKQVNDTLGHAVGDAVLRAIGQELRNLVRQYDHVGRFGGEEFVMLLPQTSIDDGVAFAQRIRESICNLDAADLPKVTVSLGITQWRAGEDAQLALARADQALYCAKKNGRNRVEQA